MIYKKSWKYILIRCSNLYYYPKALKDFSDVLKGDVGGYVQGYYSLSQEGNCWVYDCAAIIRNAHISENAQIRDNTIVTDNAKVSGNAIIKDKAQVCKNACVCENAVISECARVTDDAKVMNNAQICGYVQIYGDAVISKKDTVLNY
jgi:carbonic anhydrase/acetyltransferase-like protein (isoleucine patch superfamily)